MKIFRNKTLIIWLAVLLGAIAILFILAYSRPVFIAKDVSTYNKPEPTEAVTYSAEEKESIQSEFESNAVRVAKNAKEEVVSSKVFNLAVSGVSKGIQFGKKLWRGDYIDGYVPDNASTSEFLPEGIEWQEFLLPYNFELAEVVRVVDGDTLKVSVLESNAPQSSCYGIKEPVETYVRLIGVNTSESAAAGKAAGYVDDDYDTTIGDAASAYTKELIEEGQLVWLQFDETNTDRYGRLLRHVWLEQPDEGDPYSTEAVTNKTLNALLLMDGIAESTSYTDNQKYQELYNVLMEEAKYAKAGLWAITETMSARE